MYAEVSKSHPANHQISKGKTKQVCHLTGTWGPSLSKGWCYLTSSRHHHGPTYRWTCWGRCCWCGWTVAKRSRSSCGRDWQECHQSLMCTLVTTGADNQAWRYLCFVGGGTRISSVVVDMPLCSELRELVV